MVVVDSRPTKIDTATILRIKNGRTRRRDALEAGSAGKVPLVGGGRVMVFILVFIGDVMSHFESGWPRTAGWRSEVRIGIAEVEGRTR